MQRLSFLMVIIFILSLTDRYCYGQTQSYNPADLNWYLTALQRELTAAKEQIAKLKEDKGYDPKVKSLLKEASSQIQTIEAKLHELQTTKVATSNVLITMSVIKERWNTLRDDLVALATLVQYDPQNFTD